MSRKTRSRRAARWLALALFLAATAAAAQQVNVEPRELYLEVFINGRSTNLITRFTDLGGGGLSADADELVNTGILPGGEGRQGEVRVDKLPISYAIDETAQSLRVEASNAALAAKEIRATPAPDDLSDEAVDSGFGLVVNYDLGLETSLGNSASRFAAGDFDARMFSPIGALSHGFVVAQEDGGLFYRRLDTYWRTALPGRAFQVQLGDVTSRGPSSTRSVRLGGVLIERNFELRPDLVTIPLPEYEGSAALPSTLEVYSDSIRQFSAEVPAGPFALTDLPFGTGSGNAEVIVRDVTGRETRIDLPFLVSADLMRPGVFDFALAFGRPRLGIGTETDRYGDESFGTGTFRIGLTDRLTVSAHAEAGGDLAMAGVAATFAIGTLGTATGSYARSRWGETVGTLGEVSGQLSFGKLRLSGRMMRSNGTFADIARVTEERPARVLDTTLAGLNQISINLPVGGGGSSANLFHAETWTTHGTRETSDGIGYSGQVFGETSFSLSALSVRGETPDTVIGVGLSFALGGSRSAGANAERRNGGYSQSASASDQWDEDGLGRNWRIEATRAAQTSVQASAGRSFRLGRLEAGIRLLGAEQTVGLRAQGALVVAGGGLFASPNVTDAFAVVDAGAPGVDVEFENRLVGKTGRSGKLLVPGLRSYDHNNLAIDPASLPIDAEVATTHAVVRPAYRNGVTVDFGVSTSAASAEVELLDATGEPVAVGLPATLNGGTSFLVGYDGLVFATGLSASNEIVVRDIDGSECHASFAYRDEPGTVSQIDGVICQ